MSLDSSMDKVLERRREVEDRLSDSANMSNSDLAQFSRELSYLRPVCEQIELVRRIEAELADALVMVGEAGDDPDMLEMAQAEADLLKEQLPDAQATLQLLLLPKDKDDSRNAIIEVRAGTGGDEAALFAANLFSMYQRFAAKHGWKFEVMEVSETGIGGYKEATATISGQDVFARLKFESGVHRVQRVPETEAGGRIHTSAATVAVLPEAEEVDIQIPDSDIRIDTMRASGAGGQHVNTTDSAVRITHIPTGIVVTSSEKSQHQNRDIAMKALKSRLYQMELDRRNAEINAAHEAKGEAGWGNQIRSYVLQPYQMVKDLRTGFETSDTQGVLDGDLDGFMAATLAMKVAGKSRAEAKGAD